MPFIRLTVLLLFLSIFQDGVSQTLTTFGIGADLEAGAVVSSQSATPFWLRSNQYSTIPVNAPAGIVQGRVFRNYGLPDSSGIRVKKIDWGFVVNSVSTWDSRNNAKVLLPEAHAKVRFGNVEFYAGRKKELMGLGDSTLSSGFFAGSGNALPIPKVQIATLGFVPLRFTGGFVSVNAGFAHGWINTPPYMEAARLHQKYVYFKLGKPGHRVRFSFGINHQVLWAGHSDYLKKHPELALDGQLPSSWKFFPNVIFAYTPKNWNTKSGYTSFDSYRLGNHLGSYDASVETVLWGRKFMAYHQHPYEDISSLMFQNAPDGLWGINYALNVDRYKPWGFKLTRLTAEFLTTKSQTGPSFYIPGSKFQGGDDYFNHGQYTEGWSYFGRTIGTPFIAPGTDLKVPLSDQALFFPNNRINMWYAGAQFIYRESVLITARTSYSRNFGTPGSHFRSVLGQFSGMLLSEFPVPGWVRTCATVKLAMDNGGLFQNTFGGFVGIRKSW